MVKEISESEFKDAVKEGVSVVDFSATWCGPCQMLKPVFQEVSSDFEGKVKFFSVDVDSAPDLSRELGIMAVPSLFIFKDGEQKSAASGFQPKEVLSKWISETL